MVKTNTLNIKKTQDKILIEQLIKRKFIENAAYSLWYDQSSEKINKVIIKDILLYEITNNSLKFHIDKQFIFKKNINYYLTSDDFEISLKIKVKKLSIRSDKTLIEVFLPEELLYNERRTNPRINLYKESLKCEINIGNTIITKVRAQIVDSSSHGLGILISNRFTYILSHNDVVELTLNVNKNLNFVIIGQIVHILKNSNQCTRSCLIGLKINSNNNLNDYLTAFVN